MEAVGEGSRQVVAKVWTVGHSDHEPERFVDLLRQHGISAVADVRSAPYSRHVPQFCKDTLAGFLRLAGIAYVFLGRELGARSDDQAVFTGERVDFEKLAASGPFRQGLERLRSGAEQHRIALVCAEHDPLHCHRAILVGRRLRELDVQVDHIHRDGALEAHCALEGRLLDHFGLGAGDLFTPHEQKIAQAYEQQGREMAWIRPADES